MHSTQNAQVSVADICWAMHHVSKISRVSMAASSGHRMAGFIKYKAGLYKYKAGLYKYKAGLYKYKAGLYKLYNMGGRVAWVYKLYNMGGRVV